MHPNYKIFDYTLRSSILLPELNYCPSPTAQLSFTLSSPTLQPTAEPAWLHHWLLPSGEKSISFGKTSTEMVISFPSLADFFFSPTASKIVCRPRPATPEATIRHLLLDQVIPRIVNSFGRPVIHASGTVIDKAAVVFLGETGWGKSTLCAYFHQSGFPLLSDDAILLEKTGDEVVGMPGYAGMRLLDDSFAALHLCNHNEPVAGNSAKKRIYLGNSTSHRSAAFPLKAIFVLNDPKNPTTTEKPILFSRITGAAAAMEVLRHCFHLDPTDILMMGQHLITVSDFLAAKRFFVFKASFHRNHQLLPNICKELISFVASLSSPGLHP